MPGAYTSGTNHFLHAGMPADEARAAEYDERYGRLRADLDERLVALIPPEADAADVAEEIARVVDLPAGERPLRTHVDPGRDGSEVVSVVADRVRAEFYRRVGIDDLLTPAASL